MAHHLAAIPHTPREVLVALRSLYARAPATTLTFGSLSLSYLFTRARLSYALYASLGAGGPFARLPPLLAWLLHSALTPLSSGVAQRRDPAYLPHDDEAKEVAALRDLPRRQGRRPFVYGLAPHRQVEGGVPREVGAGKWHPYTAIAEHIAGLASSHTSLRTAPSALEGGDSPALFAVASPAGTPSPLALSYLSGTAHEFAHLHASDSSLHVVLSPRDARAVLRQGWGELHGLAGVGYGGFWVPAWARGPLRWGRANGGYRGAPYRTVALPPTYCILYAPRDEAEAQVVCDIVDAAVEFATGAFVRPYTV